MKAPSSRRKDGFTLVELLVVIAIIAVLAGAGFAAGSAAIQKAKKTTALATVVALESAVNNFYTEYGSMPTSAATETAIDINSAEGKTLLTVLLGLTETTNPPLNPRAIKFLSVREGKPKGAAGGINGIIYNSTGTIIVGLFDPWGGPYKLVMDTNYDEKIVTAPKAGGGATLNSRRVAAWSDGADYSAASSKSGDDVKNW